MLTRRKLISQGVAAAGWLGLLSFARRDHAAEIAAASPYGPLTPTFAEGQQGPYLTLPPGFRYRVLSRAEGTFDDGNPSPRLPDAMGVFANGNELRIVRNHEVRDATLPLSPGPWSYDAIAGGGTSTLVIDPVTRQTLRRFVSLSGTVGNCAGGPTPWGSWLSCEESIASAGVFAKNHGYVFEVPAGANSAVVATPLRWMGRFVHESASVDPLTGNVYLTEDQERAGLYRCVPNKPGDLAAGGRLQMLAIRNQPRYDAATGQQVSKRLAVTWVDIPDPDPANASQANPSAVFDQGFARGAARFRRLEGTSFHGDSLVFTSTTGGDRGIGQVWELRLRVPPSRKHRTVSFADSEGELTLLYESPAVDELYLPDNLTVTPRGALLLCEDPGSATAFLRVLTRAGTIFPFAQNIAFGFGNTTSEFCGATFSPDAKTLFVNLQGPGLTMAIWGPWELGPI